MKHIKKRLITHPVVFCGDEVEVKELSIREIMSLQDELSKQDSMASMDSVINVLKMSVVGCEKMTEEEFQDFPLKQLIALSDEVLKINGLGATEGNS